MTKIRVVKRNGKLEDLDISKIHRIVQWATDGIANVSVSDIEMNAQLSFYDKISTDEIHSLLVKSASNLVTHSTVNYDKVAARLALYQLRKQVWGESDPPRLYDFINQNKNIYDPDILEKYSESEIHKINKYVKHNRDENYSFAGIQQMIDKYLIKDRNSGKIFETPQLAYILISMCAFMNYPEEKRLTYVKRAYDYFSQFKINLPTPIIAGLRTKIKQYASCILIDCDDSLESIFATTSAVGHYTARRAGIGLNAGKIRPIKSPIRGGEVVHTGVIPFLKVFESTAKSTSQNGIRGGGGTVNFPIWHYEIEDILVLKNNLGTDDNRVRKLDYTIQFSKLFYDRIIKNEDITLFSPSECKGLYDVWGMPEFDDLYIKYENDKKIKFKKKINARKLIESFSRERLETGRYYVMNIDHVNSHGSWKIPVQMTNLCVEIGQPTKPIKNINDPEGEIGVCVLGAINMTETKLADLPEVCDLVVRFLDEIITNQEYAAPAAENFATNRRSLGIGITNLAGYIAKNQLSYKTDDILKPLHQYMEHLQYYLLKASNELAVELGPCAYFSDTKYSDGVLPIDTYNKNVDDLVENVLELDWESLRESIKTNGLRNSTVTAQMPCESSSVVSNSTNGIEPVRNLISYKKSKAGILKQIVPHYKNANYYDTAWTISNKNLTDISAVMQKFIDMAMSTNHYYNYADYPDGNIPLSQLLKDQLYAFKRGIKCIYYTNTPDGDVESHDACAGGSCSI